MQQLRTYFVHQNNVENAPYYEPEFRDRSDKLRVTLPQDGTTGSIYLLYQLFTQCDAADSLAHHFSIMQLLSQHQNYLYLQLLLKPLAYFCTLALYKLGQIDMKPAQAEEVYATPGTADARFLALKMLQKLAVLNHFFAAGFGFAERPIEWYCEPSTVFQKTGQEKCFNLHHIFDKVTYFINQSQFDVQQFLDEQLFKYINANTQSILNIAGFAPGFIFSATDLIAVLIATAGDPEYRVAKEAVETLRIMQDTSLSSFTNLLFASHLHVPLADMFCAKVYAPYSQHFYSCNTGYYLTCMSMFSEILTHQLCVSVLSQTNLIKTLADLCYYQQFTESAAECLLYAVEANLQGVSQIVARCQPNLPMTIIRNILTEESEHGMRLSAMLLQNRTICECFADQIQDLFEVLKEKTFTAQSVLNLINRAAKIPRAQVHINQWLKEGGDLQKWVRASYQPETSEILIKQEFLVNYEVLEDPINRGRGRAE